MDELRTLLDDYADYPEYPQYNEDYSYYNEYEPDYQDRENNFADQIQEEIEVPPCFMIKFKELIKKILHLETDLLHASPMHLTFLLPRNKIFSKVVEFYLICLINEIMACNSL